MALAASQGWFLHQMNVKIYFLHGFLKEEVFVEQPLGFEVHDQKTRVKTEESPLWFEASSKSLVCLHW